VQATEAPGVHLLALTVLPPQSADATTKLPTSTIAATPPRMALMFRTPSSRLPLRA
jgi:hypothetical protein